MASAATPADDGIDDLDVVLDASARYALGGVDGHQFIAWFQGVVPMLAERFVAAIEGGEENRRAALYSLGRLLWNRLPLPDNHFRPRPLPKPERNGPCPCGSGRKYKHCCANAENFGDPFEQVSLLKYVLQQYPRTRLKELPLAELSAEELGFIGGEWLHEGRAADAAVLLERLFADLERLDERAELAFDVLADCYDALHRPRKKQALIERCLAAPDKTLRSAALHRRITIIADRGDRAEAWRLFGEAQRLQPDNPMLATLEITMLLSEGDRERLLERGKFWIARLARDRTRDYGDMIGHIRELIANPDETALRYESHDRPGLQNLRDLIARMPPPACRYDVQRDEHEACLQPRLDMRKLLAEWRGVLALLPADASIFAAGNGVVAGGSPPGIDWLQRHPLAWQCFEILDNLAHSIVSLDLMGADRVLVVPLLERGVALLRLTLCENHSERVALPWTFTENRAALRMVAALVRSCHERRQVREARELAEWMTGTLDPRDSHGLRAELVQMCLTQDDPQAALAICDRYPNDLLAATLFCRPLALYRLGRRDEAVTALRDAARSRPRILPMLFAADPKPPRCDPGVITIGGKDEAWQYREEFLPLWQRAGALDWAREVAPRGKGK
ncbi:MAG: SEC-C metal-binding domain-containing protein [Betaproteobacteria bacterium]